MQEDKFDIGSESWHFCFWVEFLVNKSSLYSICNVYSEDFFRFTSSFVSSMLPSYLHFLHSCVVLFIKYCSVLSLLIIRSLDSNTSGIWCLKLSMELWLLFSMIILSGYSM